MMAPDGGPAEGPAPPPHAYGEFRVRQVPEYLRPAFDDLRGFCVSLGGNVIEDVRPHRVIFCKSMNTRWFVDAKPAAVSDAGDGDDAGAGAYAGSEGYGHVIRIKIRTGWRDPIRTVHIRGGEDSVTREIRDAIAAAYDKVR